MNPANQQRFDALRVAHTRKRQMADVRVALRTQQTTLEDVLSDPPECIQGIAMCELLRMLPRVDRVVVERLGRRALAEGGVNLLVRVGKASERTKAWVVANQPTYETNDSARARRRRMMSDQSGRVVSR